tara:strand:- start:251 stop:469 length:219 start_codon:yes stop_codon:yes gene_type:complete
MPATLIAYLITHETAQEEKRAYPYDTDRAEGNLGIKVNRTTSGDLPYASAKCVPLQRFCHILDIYISKTLSK